MKQELAKNRAFDATIVWSPMMPDDDEAAARAAARDFKGTKIEHFYDPERRVGLALRRDVFPDAYEKALAALPEDHWLREALLEHGPAYGERPEWDIYLFFDRAATWGEKAPAPARFVRHMGRVGENGESLMWIDGYDRAPVEGDLTSEIQRLSREVAK